MKIQVLTEWKKPQNSNRISISSLPPGVFAGLTDMETIRKKVCSRWVEAFAGLTDMETLDFGSNWLLSYCIKFGIHLLEKSIWTKNSNE